MDVKNIEVLSDDTELRELELLTGHKIIRAYSPFIGSNGNWFIYDDLNDTYIDTGVQAQGNVNFAAFKVVNGRLKMYSKPEVDKVLFKRVGSRLKYRLNF